MAEYDDLPVMLKVEEVTALLQLSRGATYKMISRGIIPSVRFGKIIRVPKVALLPLLQKPAPLRQRPTTAGRLNSWIEHIAADVDDE